MRQEGISDKTLLRVFYKLENILRKAYYSTPPHIASKTLIERALNITRSMISFLESRTSNKDLDVNS